MHSYFTSLSDRTRGIFFVMFAVIVWTGWMVLSSYSVHTTTNYLSAYDITALRFGTAMTIMFPLLVKKGFRLGPWGIGGGIWLATMMGAPYNVVAIIGMKFAPMSHASMIQTTMVVMTTIGGLMLLHEKTHWLKISGHIISIAGVFCLLTAQSATTNGTTWMGHGLFIISGTMWSVYAVSMKKWKLDPMHTTAAVCFYSGALYLPVYFLFLPSHISLMNWHMPLFQAVYQGIINSVFALICFNRGVSLLGASTASAFLPLIPAMATVASIPMLGQVPTAQEWLGVAVASIGVFLSSGILGNLLGKKEAAIA